MCRRTVSEIELQAAVHLLSTLRQLCGFCTISEEAALAFAGAIAVDNLADEMRGIYEIKWRRQVQEEGVLKKEEHLLVVSM